MVIKDILVMCTMAKASKTAIFEFINISSCQIIEISKIILSFFANPIAHETNIHFI